MTDLVLQSLWATVTGPHTTEAHTPTACVLQLEKPLEWEAHGPQGRAAPAHRN